MSQPIIQLVNVTKSFDSQVVIDCLSMDFPAGKTTVIAGASGQGKSVTLKLILGLIKPDSGQILVDGHDITKIRKKELNKIRTKFGVLFQGGALLDSLTLFDNVALPLRERTNLSNEKISEKVHASLVQFGLEGHEDKYPAQLSGGMKKRAGLARAVQLKPGIMLFDEPTTGLDPEKSMEIYRLFFDTQQELGYTSIIVSHDIPRIFNLADQVVVINRGRITTFMPPEEIQRSEIPEIKSLISHTMGDIYTG